MTIAILLKKTAIWLNTLALPSVASSAMTGTSQSASQTAATPQGARDGRPGVLGQLVAEQAVDDGRPVLLAACRGRSLT